MSKAIPISFLHLVTPGVPCQGGEFNEQVRYYATFLQRRSTQTSPSHSLLLSKNTHIPPFLSRGSQRRSLIMYYLFPPLDSLYLSRWVGAQWFAGPGGGDVFGTVCRKLGWVGWQLGRGVCICLWGAGFLGFSCTLSGV